MKLLLVPGTAALGGHRYTAAGMHASSPMCIHSTPKLTPLLEALSFVTDAGFESLSEQMKMLLTCCCICLLKNDQTELLQAMQVSALVLLHKKMWIAQLHPSHSKYYNP